jgi:MFS family permease
MLALQFLLLGLGALLAAAREDGALLLPGLALIGLGASIYHPVGLPLAAETGPRVGIGVGRALGVNGVWGNMGVAAAPLLSGWLAARLGWQSAFLLPGALSLVTGLAFLPLCRGWPRPAAAAAAPSRGPGLSASGDTDAERWRIMAFLLVAALFGGLVFAAMTVALPKMLAETPAAGFSLGDALTGATLGAAGLASLILLVAVPQVLLFALLALLQGWTAILLLALVVPLIFGEIPLHDSLAVRAADPRWRARFFAAKYMLSLGVSSAAVPIIAWLHDPEVGFRLLFALLAVAVAGIVVAALALLPGARRTEVPPLAPVMAQTKRPRSI